MWLREFVDRSGDIGAKSDRKRHSQLWGFAAVRAGAKNTKVFRGLAWVMSGL
jgi:hypothetical protein